MKAIILAAGPCAEAPGRQGGRDAVERRDRDSTASPDQP